MHAPFFYKNQRYIEFRIADKNKTSLREQIKYIIVRFFAYVRCGFQRYIARTQHVWCACGERARHDFDVHPGFFAPRRALPSLQCGAASDTVTSARPCAEALVVYAEKEVLCALGPGKYYEVMLAVHGQQPFVAPVRLLVDVQFYPEHAIAERVFLDASE